MKPELKYIFGPPDLATSLKDYTPEDPFNVHIHARLMIGVTGEEGEESFDIIISTPKGLLNVLKEDEILSGRHYLFTNKYDYTNILNYLTSHINSIEKGSWDEVGEMLSRLGYWEFEDYSN